MDNKVLETAIEKLREKLKTNFPTETQLKFLKNIGDSLYFIKFLAFNDFGLNLTIQIPSNFFYFIYIQLIKPFIRVNH